jgi:hypothetical protein
VHGAFGKLGNAAGGVAQQRLAGETELGGSPFQLGPPLAGRPVARRGVDDEDRANGNRP